MCVRARARCTDRSASSVLGALSSESSRKQNRLGPVAGEFNL